MNDNRHLKVMLNDRMVGTLAETKNHLVAFEYEDEWLESGFSISPLSLPLQKGVFLPRGFDPFEGVFGVFADSMPDGWGRLLVDRFMMRHQIDPRTAGSISRLGLVGDSGMGALEYRPSEDADITLSGMTLDELAEECRKIFEKEHTDHLDELFLMGGSSGGARPKVYYEMDGEEWIVKFPSSMDRDDIGVQEYAYALCAQKCGISTAEVRLLPSEHGSGYFAAKRFDREDGRKVHMLSVSGMLETSHRIPNLDYNILMQLTMKVTRNYKQLEKLYRLMCFNVFAHNRDDHSKNFSYLFRNGEWELSPAYDLTYSSSIGGEHATTVDGNGVDPGMADILRVAKLAKLDMKKARVIAEDIEEIVHEELLCFQHIYYT